MKLKLTKGREWKWLSGLTLMGFLVIGCSEGSGSMQQANVARSNVVSCVCNSEANKACDPKIPEDTPIWERNNFQSFTPGQEIPNVRVEHIAEFETLYPGVTCETPEGMGETAQRSGVVRESPYGPKKDLPESFQPKAGLVSCATVASQAKKSTSAQNVTISKSGEEVFGSPVKCHDLWLIGSDPKAPWYGMSESQMKVYRQKLIDHDSKFKGGVASSPRIYACQRQHRPFAPAHTQLEIGQSQFMEEYAAFHFENPGFAYDAYGNRDPSKRFGYCKVY